jgi:protein-disulfide isomerase
MTSTTNLEDDMTERTKGDRLWSLATGLMVTCAIAMTALLARRELSGTPAAGAEFREVPGWDSIAAVGQAIGERNAPVTIVEFGDYQCPACAALHADLNRLLAEHPGRVRIVYRHFPLTRIHEFAQLAAEAAECAAVQGTFGPMHDALFARSKEIGVEPWSAFAAKAGVKDTAELDRCVREHRTADVVNRDAKLARALGATGTPALIVAGRLIPGRPPYEALEQLAVKGR